MADVYQTGLSVGDSGSPYDATQLQQQGGVTNGRVNNLASVGQAYQPDMGNLDQSRQAQANSLALAQAAANGQGLQSQTMGQQALNASLHGQQSVAMGARGGSIGQIAAMRQQQEGAAGFQAQGQQSLAAQKAAEMAQAQQQYMQQSSAMRGQDLQTAQMQSANEYNQRQMNQQSALGFQGLSDDADYQQAQNDLGVSQMNSQNWQQWNNTNNAMDQQAGDLKEHRIDDQNQLIAGMMGGIGAGGAKAMTSDPRAKWDVIPLMDSPDGRQLHQTPQGQAYFADVPTMQTRDGRPSLEVVEMAPQQRQSPPLGQAAHARAKAAPEARRQMTDADLMRAADAIGQQQRSDFDARMAQGPSVMADANRALAPSAYRYQDAYTPPGQAPGEVNVGPMADRMAQSPLSATAVKRAPDGMMMIDHGKGLRLALGGVGSLQQQVDELRQQQGGR